MRGPVLFRSVVETKKRDMFSEKSVKRFVSDSSWHHVVS